MDDNREFPFRLYEKKRLLVGEDGTVRDKTGAIRSSICRSVPWIRVKREHLSINIMRASLVYAAFRGEHRYVLHGDGDRNNCALANLFRRPGRRTDCRAPALGEVPLPVYRSTRDGQVVYVSGDGRVFNSELKYAATEAPPSRPVKQITSVDRKILIGELHRQLSDAYDAMKEKLENKIIELEKENALLRRYAIPLK